MEPKRDDKGERDERRTKRESGEPKKKREKSSSKRKERKECEREKLYFNGKVIKILLFFIRFELH